jgi:hypothetical protein
MDKVLGIIVAASVIVLISAVIIPTLVSTWAAPEKPAIIFRTTVHVVSRLREQRNLDAPAW